MSKTSYLQIIAGQNVLGQNDHWPKHPRFVQLQTHAQDAIAFYLPLITIKYDRSQTHGQDEAIVFHLPLQHKT